jgi:uncharacterized protein
MTHPPMTRPTTRTFDIGARLAALTGHGGGEAQFTMRITADGEWLYQGSRIPRPALVKLFATALQRAEDGSYWLVTPVEAGRVEVEDVPFTIVELSIDAPGPNQTIRLRTNLDEWLTLDADHPLTMRSRSEGDGPAPYVVARPAAPGRLALEARLLRPVFYELVDLAAPDDATGSLEVTSAGARFSLGRLDDP